MVTDKFEKLLGGIGAIFDNDYFKTLMASIFSAIAAVYATYSLKDEQ